MRDMARIPRAADDDSRRASQSAGASSRGRLPVLPPPRENDGGPEILSAERGCRSSEAVQRKLRVVGRAQRGENVRATCREF